MLLKLVVASFFNFARCGGQLRNSVYSASERILGLSMIKTGRLPVLEPVTISGSMINGLNVTFSFKLGDGSETLEPSEEPQIRHIYDQPGSYVVSMEATNPITGSITVSEVGMLKFMQQTQNTFTNTEKKVENTTYSGVFLTKLEEKTVKYNGNNLC